MDTEKKVIAGVTVSLKTLGFEAVTDSTGRFTLDIPDPGDKKTVVLEFERKGYYSLKKRIKVEEQEYTFRLLFIPRDRQLHEISVTAMNREEKILDVPMAEHRVSSLDIQEKITENVMDTLADTPGVHFIGSGGYSVTPTIRGLARRRVLILVDGARVTSDRRAGTSAGFIQPEISNRIEVVRSPSSVLYGSDAIGGVINILTRPSKNDPWDVSNKNRLNLNYNSVNERFNTGIGLQQQWNRWQVYTGFQYSHAGDYQSPGEKILHSGYTYYSGIADVSYRDKDREFFLGYVGGLGIDVGKPERSNNPGISTNVPNENEQYFRLGYSEKKWIPHARLDFSLYINPSSYDLENADRSKNSWERSETQVTNLGVKAILEKEWSASFKYQVGVEWFSRQNLRIVNITRSLDQPVSEAESTLPLDNGVRNDYSMFLALQYSGISHWDMHGGVRYTFFSMAADTTDGHLEKEANSCSLFVGTTYKITNNLSLFFNVARAYRMPSLSESFYTGITGRKFVIGNPLLEPESSWNFDLGLKYAGKKVGIGFYLFTNRVDQMIERYRDENKIYTYDNIYRGNIYGGEIELEYHPLDKLEFFGHYFYYHGRSSPDDQNLNDVTAPRLLVGGKYMMGKTWLEAEYTVSFKKSDPGPSELANDAYHLLDIKGGVYLSADIFIYLKLSNLLDEEYYANADPDIPLSKGFGLSSGLHFYF